MSTVTPQVGPVEPPVAEWVRDPLGSDLDDRVVLRLPVVRRPRWTEATRWPLPHRDRHLPAGWPIAVAVAGWPLWWALGVTNLVFTVAAVPLAWQLSRRRHLKVPPGFALWGLFLLLVLLSGFAIDAPLAGTGMSEGIGRYFSFSFRFLNYLAVTVVMLYVGNTSEAELPRRRIIGWLGVLAVWCVLLGTISLAHPQFSFTTPASYVLPGALTGDSGGVVTLAQFQPVLGDASPRPAAPFPYTNAWGNNLSLLLVWLVVGWGVLGTKSRRLMLGIVLVIAMAPIVFSLNRGMWMGLGLAVFVAVVRLAFCGRVKALLVLVGVLSVLTLTVAASPLEGIISSRLDNGHSNEVRGSLLGTAIDAAQSSPIIGFGSTRNTLGSDESIAIGPSEACPRCGGRTIGSTGQLTLLLVSQGFLGVALYMGFLLWAVIAFARDRSPLGLAGTLVVAMEIFYAMVYSALTMPLGIAFLSIGLLWRNDRLRRGLEVVEEPLPAELVEVRR
jgi:hypothetical protein